MNTSVRPLVVDFLPAGPEKQLPPSAGGYNFVKCCPILIIIFGRHTAKTTPSFPSYLTYVYRLPGEMKDVNLMQPAADGVAVWSKWYNAGLQSAVPWNSL